MLPAKGRGGATLYVECIGDTPTPQTKELVICTGNTPDGLNKTAELLAESTEKPLELLPYQSDFWCSFGRIEWNFKQPLFKNPRPPDGATTLYGHDSELQLTSVTNSLGEVATFKRDLLMVWRAQVWSATLDIWHFMHASNDLAASWRGSRTAKPQPCRLSLTPVQKARDYWIRSSFARDSSDLRFAALPG